MVEVEWAKLNSQQLNRLSEEGASVIVPVGSIEQHGPHLPVHTDSLLVGEIARRSAFLISREKPALVLPTIWSGLSEHHIDFGGTITIDFSAMLSLLRCVCGSLARQNFRKILFLNGHGGNSTALMVAVDQLTQELKLPLLACNYWDPAAQRLEAILERQSSLQHACEAETSMMMALVPELVDLDCIEAAKGEEPPEMQDKSRGYRWWSFAEVTESGVLGDATAASPNKGERLLHAAAEAVAKVVLEAGVWAHDAADAGTDDHE